MTSVQNILRGAIIMNQQLLILTMFLFKQILLNFIENNYYLIIIYYFSVPSSKGRTIPVITVLLFDEKISEQNVSYLFLHVVD